MSGEHTTRASETYWEQLLQFGFSCLQDSNALAIGLLKFGIACSQFSVGCSQFLKGRLTHREKIKSRVKCNWGDDFRGCTQLYNSFICY